MENKETIDVKTMDKKKAVDILVENFLDHFNKDHIQYDEFKEAFDLAITSLSKDTSYEDAKNESKPAVREGEKLKAEGYDLNKNDIERIVDYLKVSETVFYIGDNNITNEYRFIKLNNSPIMSRGEPYTSGQLMSIQLKYKCPYTGYYVKSKYTEDDILNERLNVKINDLWLFPVKSQHDKIESVIISLTESRQEFKLISHSKIWDTDGKIYRIIQDDIDACGRLQYRYGHDDGWYKCVVMGISFWSDVRVTDILDGEVEIVLNDK